MNFLTIIKSSIIQSFLLANHYSMCFPYLNSFILQQNPMSLLLLSLFFRWENRGTEVTLPVHSKYLVLFEHIALEPLETQSIKLFTRFSKKRLLILHGTINCSHLQLIFDWNLWTMLRSEAISLKAAAAMRFLGDFFPSNLGIMDAIQLSKVMSPLRKKKCSSLLCILHWC